MGTEADDMIGPDHEVTAMYGPATVTVADEVRRARRLGIILRISKDEDRLPTDTRQNPCPTCNDGTLSAMFPRQCRWCEPITRALRGL